MDGITFSLVPGECLGLLGANGSGKSTTLRCLLGIHRPTSGDLEVLGGAPGRKAARAKTAYVPEEARRFGTLNGFETVDLFARIQGVGPRRERRSRVEDALAIVGLEQRAWRQRVSAYSRGMARRLAMAAAWVHRPRIMILDEPTSGLDPLGVRDLVHLIRTAVEDETAVILSTHDRVTAEEACDRALVLDHGKIVLSGSPDELLGDVPSASLLPLFERGHDG